MKKYRKLINKIEYPLFMRYGEFSNPKVNRRDDENSSVQHQVIQSYRTYPFYKDIVIVKL